MNGDETLSNLRSEICRNADARAVGLDELEGLVHRWATAQNKAPMAESTRVAGGQHAVEFHAIQSSIAIPVEEPKGILEALTLGVQAAGNLLNALPHSLVAECITVR